MADYCFYAAGSRADANCIVSAVCCCIYVAAESAATNLRPWDAVTTAAGWSEELEATQHQGFHSLPPCKNGQSVCGGTQPGEKMAGQPTDGRSILANHGLDDLF